MKILAIETSCDETAIAILENLGILSSVVLSQIKIHKPFGGVVPNLAQREHQKNLVPILKLALKESGLLKAGEQKIKNLDKKLEKILEREPVLLQKFKNEVLKIKKPRIDAIALTHGPGLEPALWVGINFAKALSEVWEIPIIPVNHLEGHIYSNWLKDKNNPRAGTPRFPLLALIVSGGHTEIVLMKKDCDYKILGETRDDAAGEAFDKVAKMLKLGYPGGPLISKLAEKGNPDKVNFPRPMINSSDFDFSFSGLKTAVLYKLREDNNLKKIKKYKTDVAASFEQAVVDVLVKKTEKALKVCNVKSLVVGGGVAANKKLRASLQNMVKNKYPGVSLWLSPMWLTGDNAAMIGAAAYFKFAKLGKAAYINPSKLMAKGNLGL